MWLRAGLLVLILHAACVGNSFAQATPCNNVDIKCPVQGLPKLNLNFDFKIDLQAKPAKRPITKFPPKPTPFPREVVRPDPPQKLIRSPAPRIAISKPKVEEPKPSWAGLPEVGPTQLLANDMVDIPDQYIVDFNIQALTDQGLDLKTITLNDLAARLGLESTQIRSVQRRFLFSAALTAKPDQATALATNPLVKTLHRDTQIKAAGSTPPLSWGLDRLDSPTLPLDNHFDRDFGEYQARVYVFDTAVDQAHGEFGNRVKEGASFVSLNNDKSKKCREHGTEMASLIAGQSTGAAPKAEIVPLVVLPCQREETGSASSLVEAAEWLLIREADFGDGKPALANMSLAGKWSRKINDTVAVLVENQVAVVVAAGNNAQDACRFSPASAKDAITVAATGPRDEMPGFSNFGPCVKIFAPGRLITALTENKTDRYVAANGTSGATALVSGLLARSLKSKGPIAAAQWLAEAGVPAKLWSKTEAEMKLAQINPSLRNFCRVSEQVPTIKLYEGPEQKNKSKKVLYANAVVQVVGLKPDWVQVKAPGGSKGWLPKSTSGAVSLLELEKDEACKAAE